MTRIRQAVAALATTALLGVGAAGCDGAGVQRGDPQPAAKPDGGVHETPDAGPPDAGPPDAGPPDAGPSAGPWPDEPVLNYSQKYALGRVRAMGVDDAYNLWLLDGERIGVLRPGDTQPKWTARVGQAKDGFGHDQLAMGSTVICGGKAGEAFVGYMTYELDGDPEFPGLHPSYMVAPGETKCVGDNGGPPCYGFSQRRWDEFKRGDMDIVKLEADGTVALREHLSRNMGSSRPSGIQTYGFRNTNDFHYDEDRTVYACRKALWGPMKGDVFVGTNHGVTRVSDPPGDGVDEYLYNSHIHPYFDNGRWIGYNYALGLSQDGREVLLGNEWKLGIYRPPPEDLDAWDSEGFYRVNDYVAAIGNGEVDDAGKDYWRAFEQTKDGLYYLGSKGYGLWEMRTRENATNPMRLDRWYTQVQGLPSNQVLALAATQDGSLFIGTGGGGLWRMKSDKTLERVTTVSGSNVSQLLYDPTVSPAMLYVLTDAGLTVLRGH